MSKEISTEKSCKYNDFKRARYFHGMLMTDRDFREEQLYHNKKRKLLNRMLHGWGVVCGLKMKLKACESSKIIIEPGLALDCHGDEIFVCEEYELNVGEKIKPCSTPKKTRTLEQECPPEDTTPPQENKRYVVIKYKEVPTDPVPVYAPGGGCEEKVCDYSRTREGYCFELRHVSELNVECPEPLYQESEEPNENEDPCKKWEDITSDSCEEKKEAVRQFLCEDLLMPCPGTCCKDPVVVLGSLTLGKNDTSGIKIETINNWDCRRYVITFGLLQYWMKCFAPTKVPFEAIVNYALLKDACKSKESAVEAFRDICREEKEEEGREEPPKAETSEDVKMVTVKENSKAPPKGSKKRTK